MSAIGFSPTTSSHFSLRPQNLPIQEQCASSMSRPMDIVFSHQSRASSSMISAFPQNRQWHVTASRNWRISFMPMRYTGDSDQEGQKLRTIKGRYGLRPYIQDISIRKWTRPLWWWVLQEKSYWQGIDIGTWTRKQPVLLLHLSCRPSSLWCAVSVC